MDWVALLKRVRDTVPVAVLVRFHSVGLVEEYVRFLALKVSRRDFAALPPELTPSPLVDAVWQTHMLLAHEFARTCRALLPPNVVFTYIPGMPMDPSSYAQTLALYENVFGVPPNPVLWPEEVLSEAIASVRALASQSVAAAMASQLPRKWIRREPRHSRGIIVHVKALVGETVTFKVHADTSVDVMKMLIQDAQGMPPEEQRLLFHNGEMEDGKTLQDHGVCADSVIQLVERGDVDFTLSR